MLESDLPSFYTCRFSFLPRLGESLINLPTLGNQIYQPFDPHELGSF